MVVVELPLGHASRAAKASARKGKGSDRTPLAQVKSRPTNSRTVLCAQDQAFSAPHRRLPAASRPSTPTVRSLAHQLGMEMDSTSQLAGSGASLPWNPCGHFSRSSAHTPRRHSYRPACFPSPLPCLLVRLELQLAAAPCVLLARSAKGQSSARLWIEHDAVMSQAAVGMNTT